jgi:hypothetical protein
MNYLPFAGSWFYGATSDAERASYYCSWGLLAVSPSAITFCGLSILSSLFSSILG